MTTRTHDAIPPFGWSVRALLPAAAAAIFGRKVGELVAHDAQLGHHLARELLSVLAFVVFVAVVLCGAGLILLGQSRLAALPVGVKALWCALAGAGLGCIAYATLVEPYHVTVRRVEIENAKVAGEALRVVHLSDLHVRRWSRVEDQVLARVRELSPDLILLTGDYAGWPGKNEDSQTLLRRLAEIAPAYAVRGNTDLRVGLPSDPGGPTWLINRDHSLVVRGTPLSLYGIDAGAEWRVWELAKFVDKKRLNVCLYHYPDLIPNLSGCPYDLMLSGHTHGGQVRLPWIGALISLSRAGTRYARGLFVEDGRAAFVSQGVGCESFLPRMRFLCPPEVALIVLKKAS
ncbi:MAG: metallophosphoesterase [Elusimicrobia bacterium]|nr:metallophosphoesterase [Elusimicrobiota bacterium]